MPPLNSILRVCSREREREREESGVGLGVLEGKRVVWSFFIFQ
jgi:hypothetical protein